MVDVVAVMQLHQAESRHYFNPRGWYRGHQGGHFDDDLDEGTDENQPWLNDDEFQKKY